MIKEYGLIDNGKCYKCGSTEDVTVNEDGDEICTDCLFEEESEKL